MCAALTETSGSCTEYSVCASCEGGRGTVLSSRVTLTWQRQMHPAMPPDFLFCLKCLWQPSTSRELVDTPD